MPHLYLPPVAHGTFYYQLAQLAAFGLFVGLLLGQGYRRSYPWRQWLPLVAAATLALMLGCQLVFLPVGQWLAWLRGDAAVAHALAHGPRSVVGGAAVSLLAVLALKRALGFGGWAVLDAFAGPLCWALAVQCVGCGLVGCCWGEVAAPGSLGVSFGPGTLPYLAQQAHGLLPMGAAHSLPVVPTQLYHLLLCGGTGLGLHALRRQAASWPGGSRYFLAMSLLCLGRFGIEFWRDPASEPLLSATLTLAGVSLLKIQWLLLLQGLALLGGWAWLVRRGKVALRPVPTPVSVMNSTLVALGLLVLTAHFGNGLLAASEVRTLQALLLLVLLAEAQAWLPRLGWALPRPAGLPLAALLGGVLLLATAQAPAPQQVPPPRSDEAVTTHLTLSGGVLGNYHDADEEYANNPGSCGGSTRYNTYQQARAAGGEAAYTRDNAAVRTTFGAGLWLGTQRVGVHLPAYGAPFTIQPDTTFSYELADVHFYLEQERQIPKSGFAIAYRLGLHAGELGHYSYYAEANSRDNTSFAPEAMLRLGFPRVLYAQADAGYGVENALGAYTTRLALGSGFGKSQASHLLLGYANSAHQPTPHLAFASATLRLPAGTGLSALSLEPYFATDFDRHQLFSLKLNYRLGR